MCVCVCVCVRACVWERERDRERGRGGRERERVSERETDRQTERETETETVAKDNKLQSLQSLVVHTIILQLSIDFYSKATVYLSTLPSLAYNDCLYAKPSV